MNFQAHLKNMAAMMQADVMLFFLGGLLIQLLTSISFGLLAGPLMGGYLLVMLHWLRSGRRSRFNDLFSGMTRVGELFPVFVMILLTLLGFFLFFLPGVLVSVWWIYVLPLMADKRLPLLEAMRDSRRKVQETGFFMHLIFLLLITMVPFLVISVAAALIPPLAVCHYLVFPPQCACLAGLYLEQFEDMDPEQRGRVSDAPIVTGHRATPPPVPPPLPEKDNG